MPICLGVPKEIKHGEHRVALVPTVAERFKKMAVEVLLERGAGTDSYYPDKAYDSLDNTRMLYGDGPEVAGNLIAELKQL